MQLPAHKKQTSDENLIPLINIVFLILIFFLIATVIRPFSAQNIDLAKTDTAEKLHRLTLSLTIDKEGQLFHKSKPTTLEELKANWLEAKETISEENKEQPLAANPDTENQTLTLIADKELNADKLLEIVSTLSDIKFKAIKLITEDISR